MPHDIFDTSVISSWMIGRATATNEIHKYLSIHGFIPISSFTIYEIERGLLSVSDEFSRRRLEREWDRIRQFLEVYPPTREVFLEGSRIWANLGKEKARLVGDMDILIGATAKSMERGVYTENPRDFREIEGLLVFPVEKEKLHPIGQD